jgi:putative transposase
VLLKETSAMTAPSSTGPARFLHDQLESASPDLLRSMLTTFINALMSAEADAVCGAPYGMPDPGRVNVRNGYRHRGFDTRAGTLDVAIPKLRSGSYFPDWLLERRRRSEAALTSVVATCYLLGVSTRRMEKLAGSLGITRLSRSQVSEMAKDRRRAGHLRCAPRPGRGDRRDPARGCLAAMPHPLRGEPDGHDAQGVLAVGQDAAALGL